MKFITLIVIFLVVQCVFSETSYTQRPPRVLYGVDERVTATPTEKDTAEQQQKIRVLYGVDERVTATPTEKDTAEQQQKINSKENGAAFAASPQLIDSPKKCPEGYDANGNCVSDDEVFH
ncbi:hypothetical protein QE152_g5737 [Popillia japonica]|uniref:Uncharacterized protein n=1 Tax=Popillia japonica TaxID=7064 RepID=A0AAW1MHA6_POPJA